MTDLPDPDSVSVEERRRHADHAREEIVHTVEERTRKARAWQVLAVIAIVLALLALVGGILGRGTLSSQISGLKDENGSLTTQLDEQRKQFLACRDQPVGTPGCTAAVADQPNQAAPQSGVSSAGAAAIATNVVREEIARANLSLSPAQLQQVATAAAAKVPKPKDGKDATAEDVRPIVQDLVAQIPRPTGEPGQPGPAPTAEEIDGAVARFCADGQCRGADGRGITSLTQSDGHLIVTYTDGTTDDLGDVTGEAGRGIVTTTCDYDTGELVITYDKDPLTERIDSPVCRRGPLTPDPTATGLLGQKG